MACVSIVRDVEVLGYHRLHAEEKWQIEEIIPAAAMLPLTDEVARIAVRLRQQRNMTLGGALIAGAAWVTGLPLVARKVDEFKTVTGLRLIDPLEQH